MSPNAGLARELMEMAEADHRSVHLGTSDNFADQLAWRRLTAGHGDRLREIMREHGWPTLTLVGADAARAAWLVAQHADRQLDVQQRALELMEQVVASGEASRTDLAFLQDRVAVNAGHPQTYGTQIAGVRNGAPIPWPCVDPHGLDERRQQAGIAPFAEYIARFAPHPD